MLSRPSAHPSVCGVGISWSYSFEVLKKLHENYPVGSSLSDGKEAPMCSKGGRADSGSVGHRSWVKWINKCEYKTLDP